MKSLNRRLVLLTSALVAITIALAIAITTWMGRSVGDESVDKALRSSQTMQQAYAQESALRLQLVAQLIASDPAFVAYVAQATNESVLGGGGIDQASIVDLLRERDESFGFSFSMVLDPDGVVIARSDQRQTVARDVSGHAIVRDAIEQLVPVDGFWLEGGRLMRIAVIPLARGGGLIGFLMVSEAIADSQTEQVADVSGAEIAFAIDRNDELAIAATSLEPSVGDALGEALGATREQWQDGTRYRAAPAPLTLGNQHWVVQMSSTTITSPDANVLTIALVSLDEILAPSRQIRNLLIVTGVVVLAIALVASLFISRRVLNPINTLSEAVNRAARGDFGVRIHGGGMAELRDLSRSINRLVRDLKEERSLEKAMMEILKARGAADPRSGGKSHGVINDRFEVVDTLGSGGAGKVFLAHDRELGERVALKVLKPGIADDEDNIERLKQEIKVSRRVNHPNVVRVHDIGNVKGQPFISMEYVHGFTIRQILGHFSRMPLDAGLKVCREMCFGLSAAHSAGVVHRDLKPENVIVQFDGATKLMDFGIARPVLLEIQEARSEFVEGTASYLSPEQIRGETADQCSDVYALGVVMMELFTGRLPHEGEDDRAICMSHLHDPPASPATYWPQIPATLDAVILKCLEKHPSKRFQDAKQVRLALESLVL